jgi:hypothetical protein
VKVETMAERKRQEAKGKGVVSSRTRDEDVKRPEVIVDFVFEDGLFFVSVKNIGERPAVKVSVKFDQKFYGVEGTKEISALPLFRNIEFLAPQREIVAFLDRSEAYFGRQEPTKIAVKVSYRDSRGNKYEAAIRHDLEIYRELGYVRRPGSGEKKDLG